MYQNYLICGVNITADTQCIRILLYKYFTMYLLLKIHKCNNFDK